MHKKRAQAAVEFLFTYSWAFGILLIMIAAFVYFGINEPERNIPEICSLTPGFECREFGFLDDGTDLYIFVEFINRKENDLLILNKSHTQWNRAVSEFTRNRHCLLDTVTQQDFAIATRSGNTFTRVNLDASAYTMQRNTPTYLLAKLDGPCSDVLSQIQFAIPYRELRSDVTQQISMNIVVPENKILYGTVNP